MSLILGGFLHAVLRDGAHTQPTQLAVSAVIKLAFVIQKVIWQRFYFWQKPILKKPNTPEYAHVLLWW